MSNVNLSQLLDHCGLSSYLGVLERQYGITKTEHLKNNYVTSDDLEKIGMSKPEQRRLFKELNEIYPDSVFSKLKKRVGSVRNQDSNSDSDLSSTASSTNGHNSEQHIIPKAAINLCKELGEGEFGKVYQGVWSSPSGNKIQVAVKCVVPKQLQQPLDFIMEASIMHKIKHERIVRLYGLVLDTNFMLVSELAPLRSLLECLIEPSMKSNFTVLALCNYAEQICDGMCYLEADKLIHRDLAARNILVFGLNSVKISDFGLSRSLGSGEEYYRSNMSPNLKLPIAWCAPEAINFLKFTSASDVWAFGVTLWEMFSYGFQPWMGLTGTKILQAIDQPTCQRLAEPSSCPREYYELMLQCWEHDALNRPKFSDILALLPEIKPERVLMIRECFDAQFDHLQYNASDIITVLNKKPREYPDGYYWRGVDVSGQAALFLPTNSVSYLGTEMPFLASQSSSDDISSKIVTDTTNNAGGGVGGAFSKASSVLSLNISSNPLLRKANFGFGMRKGKENRQKLKPHMISGPQGDFRHTGHIGMGEAFNLPETLLDPKLNLSPKILECLSANRGESKMSSGMSLNRSSPVPPPKPSRSGLPKQIVNPVPQMPPPLPNKPERFRHYNGANQAMSEMASMEEHPQLLAADLDLNSDIRLDEPLASSSFFDFGPSLIDEVFGDMTGFDKENHNDSFVNDSEPTSPISWPPESDDNIRLIEKSDCKWSSVQPIQPKSQKQQCIVKPISQSDSRYLERLHDSAHRAVEEAFEKEAQRQEKLLAKSEEEERANLSRTSSKTSTKSDKSGSSSVATRFKKSFKLHKNPSPVKMAVEEVVCEELIEPGEDPDERDRRIYEALIETGASRLSEDYQDGSAELFVVHREHQPEPEITMPVTEDVVEEVEDVNPMRRLRAAQPLVTSAAAAARTSRVGAKPRIPVTAGVHRFVHQTPVQTDILPSQNRVVYTELSQSDRPKVVAKSQMLHVGKHAPATSPLPSKGPTQSNESPSNRRPDARPPPIPNKPARFQNLTPTITRPIHAESVRHSTTSQHENALEDLLMCPSLMNELEKAMAF